MAANMQHMGPGQMMPQQQQQQLRNGAQGQLQSYLVKALQSSPPAINMPWHNNVNLNERLQKSMQLYV
jgi:predicted RecA/RadA family phage recombinase